MYSTQGFTSFVASRRSSPLMTRFGSNVAMRTISRVRQRSSASYFRLNASPPL